MEIARKFQADVIKLSAKSYALDCKGWLQANVNSLKRNHSSMVPETVNFDDYRLIILGSPIWYCRPVPALWTFVANKSFHDM